MGLASWLLQVQQALGTVDSQFGEQVLLLPWVKGQIVATGPDTTRPTVSAIAIFKTTRATPNNVAPQMLMRFAEADAYLSINQAYLDECDFQQGDHVQLVNRNNDEYECNYVSHTPFKRSRVFLINIKPPEEPE